jgi:hypothetical protein
VTEAQGLVLHRVLHRTVKTDPPTLDDFKSNKALGEDPRGPEIDDPSIWDSVSMTDTFPRALKRAGRFPQHGAFIAEVSIPEGAMVVVRKTLGKGHYSVHGSPEMLLDCVSRVIPVDAPEEG